MRIPNQKNGYWYRLSRGILNFARMGFPVIFVGRIGGFAQRKASAQRVAGLHN